MKNETIVDRVVERLKAAPLGDLITEEDLHDIVKAAIPKTFFEPRRVPIKESWRDSWVDAPPLIIEIMSGLLKEAATKAAQDWLKDNPQMIADYWKQVCDAGLLKYVQEVQSAQATATIRSTLHAWVDDINQERQRTGATPLNVFF